MQIASVLFSFIAISTGSILSDDFATTTPAPTNEKWGQRHAQTCQLHNAQEGEPLNFTSPLPVPVITVVVQRFTSIDCSARNFCNITWFKDTYPLEVSDYVNLRHDNQTLEIQKAYYSRKGNYTCVATDGEESISRTVQLFIADTPWDRSPLPLSADTCVNQTASLGASAEFFCFFFAGNTIMDVNLAWYKWTESSEWIPVSELNSEKTQYEEMLDYSQYSEYSGSNSQPTAGKHLFIKDVTPEAFGDYRLEATSGNYTMAHTQPLSLSATPPPPMADLTAVIAASVVVACLFIAVVALAFTWHVVKLDVKIWRKNRFGALEDDDGNIYDAFISYADEDLPFALSIRERLEQFGYNVCVRDIDIIPATTLVEEIILALNTSRRCLIVISPDFIQARHSALQVDVATDQMMHRQIKIVPIIYRDVLSVDREEMPLLKRILTNVKIVRWDENNVEKFTKQLLVHMPPRWPVSLLPTEERNLLTGSVDSGAPIGGATPRDRGTPMGTVTPGNDKNAEGCERNRFLNDVMQAERKNPLMAEGQMKHALPC